MNRVYDDAGWIEHAHRRTALLQKGVEDSRIVRWIEKGTGIGGIVGLALYGINYITKKQTSFVDAVGGTAGLGGVFGYCSAKAYNLFLRNRSTKQQ